jgi:hypothetical protein
MTTWTRIPGGYRNGGAEIFDNGAGLGPAAGSGRWAIMVDGRWICNEDTLAIAKARVERRNRFVWQEGDLQVGSWAEIHAARESRYHERVAAGMSGTESGEILHRENLEYYRRTFKPTGVVTACSTPSTAASFEPGKKLIAVIKPAKLISEMSDAERRALADAIFDKAAASVKPGTWAHCKGPRPEDGGPHYEPSEYRLVSGPHYANLNPGRPATPNLTERARRAAGEEPPRLLGLEDGPPWYEPSDTPYYGPVVDEVLLLAQFRAHRAAGEDAAAEDIAQAILLQGLHDHPPHRKGKPARWAERLEEQERQDQADPTRRQRRRAAIGLPPDDDVDGSNGCPCGCGATARCASYLASKEDS